jgi:hypothetical protein
MGIATAAALASVVAVASPAAAQSQASGDLRTNLTATLAEHTLLAGNATAALLGDRPAEFQAASAALNQNSSRIAGLVGNVYGGNASSAFLPAWQRHIQYYADYANALKAGNESGRQQASSNLMQWSMDMGMLLSSPAQFRSNAQSGSQAGMSQMDMSQSGATQGSMNGNAGMMTPMMQQHVVDTMKVIDAQAANNWPLVYSLAAADVRHMKMVADSLVSQSGNAAQSQGAGVDLKATVAMLLVENAALNANATSALMNERIAEYQAASAALKDNTAALSSQLGTVYGGNAYDNLNSVWNNQSMKLAQYANALANQDVSTQQAARSNVRGFTDAFANGFTQSNAQVPALTLNGWGGTLSTGAISLIDAQDARNYAREYQLRAQTNQQLLQFTNVLGQSINEQFPNQYGIPAAPAVPSNVGSANDNTSVASGNAMDAGMTAGMGGATTSTGTADATSANATAGGVATSGDASTAGSTVLLPQTGASMQVTGTATTTGTMTAGDAVTGTATSTGTTAAGASVTDTLTTTGTTGASTTGATTSGSVLLPQTGADLSSLAQQVTGTNTTTGTTGTSAGAITGTTPSGDASTTGGSVLLPQTGADLSSLAQQVTGTNTTTGTTGSAITGTTTSGDASTTGGSVLLPQAGADLSSLAQQVTGTNTTTGTTGSDATGAGTTTTGTTAGGDASTTGSGVLLPQSGADLSQQQQQGGQPNAMVPVALVIAGVALVLAVVLMSFARRNYGQQKRDR